MERKETFSGSNRRRFLTTLGAVGAATLLSGGSNAKGFTSWRGVVGHIAPTMRPGGLETLIRLLPEGIGIIPLFNDIREASREEFLRVIGGYETKAAQLAELGVDLIYAGGSPPFMTLGYQKERELLKKWEQQFKTPVFTSGISQSEAMRAFKMKSFVGVSYFAGSVNDVFAKYFIEGGFEVLSMTGMEAAFDSVESISSLEIYRFIKKAFLVHPEADGIYLLGAGWHALEVVEMLEQDLGVPVVHPTAAQSWSIQRRLHVRQPLKGRGRLLSEMPTI